MATKSTKSYITLTEIRLDGEDVEVGATVELTDKQGEQLVALDAVKPVATPEPAKKK